MPQKKNPDVPELVRGKTGRVFGDLMALLTLLKGLPMTYNRDMQEDKVSLFSSTDTLQACLEIYIKMLPHLGVNGARMRHAAASGYLNATDMADYLVGKGVAFRKAHAIAGSAVAAALGVGKELDQLSLKELQGFSNLIEEDIFEHLTLEHMVGRRLSAGGTAKVQVAEAIQQAKERLAQQAAQPQAEGQVP
jgi:argininosuccinate lyase